VEPPSNNHFPNPNRPSNPFTPSPEPEWVDVKHMPNSRRPEPPPARGSQRSRTVDFDGPSTSLPPTQKPAARKMIAPLYPGHANQILGSDGARDSLSDLRRSGSNASTHSMPSLPYRASNTLPSAQSSNKPQVPGNQPHPQFLTRNLHFSPRVPRRGRHTHLLHNDIATTLRKNPEHTYNQQPDGQWRRHLI